MASTINPKLQIRPGLEGQYLQTVGGKAVWEKMAYAPPIDKTLLTHVGQVIMSTTLDTPQKVREFYGGDWAAWGQGRVPVGVGDNYENNYSSANLTGGNDRRTLSTSNIPRFAWKTTFHNHYAGTSAHKIQSLAGDTIKNVTTISGKFQGPSQVNGSDSIGAWDTEIGKTSPDSIDMRQKYVTVYMWRRTI